MSLTKWPTGSFSNTDTSITGGPSITGAWVEVGDMAKVLMITRLEFFFCGLPLSIASTC